MHLRETIRLLIVLDFVVHFYATTDSIGQVVPCKNCTTLLPRLDVFKKHVLSRRKRGIIFPKKAFLLLSQAFTKAIIDGRPPGLAYSIEFDMYSTLPDTVEGWQPTILNDRVKSEKIKDGEKSNMPTTAPPAVTPTPLDLLHDDKNILHLPALEETDKFQFSDNTWSTHYDNHVGSEHDAPMSISTRLWHPVGRHFKRKNKQNPAHYVSNFFQDNKWSNFDKKYSNTKRKEQMPNTIEEDINEWPPMEEEVYESADHVPIWKYHNAYRERRDLLEQLQTLGKIFNFDMKSCIQRAMCEMRSKLKPYGESLMEDIVRIILTIPKKINFRDDYFFDFSQRAEDDQLSCKNHFKQSCPYRVLDFLTSTLRTIKMDPSHDIYNMI